MRRAGATAPGIADRRLSEVAAWEGPFLSVYLTTEVAVEHPGEMAERRWSSVRRRLVEAGADDACLRAVDDRVADAHLEGAALAVVAAPGHEPFVDHHHVPLPADVGRWAPAPTLTPAVAWRQQEPPYVVALVDRQGADLVAVTRDRPPVDESVSGGAYPVSKTGGGGWAHWRIEHRVEEEWARNERAVAGRIEALVDAVDARIVIAGGDEKALGILRSALPERVADLVTVFDGARATESTDERGADEVARWVHTVAARDTVAALEELRAQHGQGGRAAEGAAATLSALRQGQVDVLVVHDDPAADDDHGTAWFDPGDPAVCALSPDELRQVGRDPLRSARLVDVAVRAALVTGASVRVVPEHGGPEEGLGALLRWAD